MRAIIAEDGDAVQCVGGNVAAGQRPFAYTVGLDIASDGGYELALSGLDPETATSVLHSLAAALAERRLKPAEGIEVNDALSHGYALRLRSVSRPEEFGIINALYGATPPERPTERLPLMKGRNGPEGSVAAARQTTSHCWFAPALQRDWSRAAPLAVDAPATSRHRPLLTLVNVT